MGNLFLSFLGTNDYLPCTYFAEDGREIQGVRFVQEATARLYCQDWTPQDRIVIFTTEEAYNKNWLDNGHRNKAGDILDRDGLCTCLSRSSLQPSVAQVSIPEGKTEAEIWSVFQTVFDVIREEDRVIFDITHAFRSIPMLALVVLTYSKVLRGSSIEGVYYGAFEAIGSVQQAAAMAVQDRRAPLFNLGPFATLMDWTLAIDQFIQSGDAKPLCALAQNRVKPILKETKGRDHAASAIRELADKLEAFTEALSTCRGQDISRLGPDLHRKIKRCRQSDLLPPLLPLLDRLEQGVSSFTGDEVFDGLQAVRWCMNHGLTQQAYTILREVLITHLAQQAGLNPKSHKEREAVGTALHMISQKKSAPINVEDLAPVSKYVAYFNTIKDFHPTVQKILDTRNDMNHAGYRSGARPARNLRQELPERIKEVQDFISHQPKENS